MQRLTPRALSGIKTVLFDCDGVLWRGTESIEGAAEAVSALRKAGKLVLFLTNNSTKSRQQYVERLARAGIPDTPSHAIFPSSFIAADHLATLVAKDERVFVVGDVGLEQELDIAGVARTGGTGFTEQWHSVADAVLDTLDASVRAVVVGFDMHATYAKIATAHAHLMRQNSATGEPACVFVGTNGDRSLPVTQGQTVPGNGFALAGLSASTGRTPTIVGKPARSAWDCIRRTHPSIAPESTLMVGDRLDTDILFGQNANLKTLLVLSGVTSHAQAHSDATRTVTPDFVAESAAELMHCLS